MGVLLFRSCRALSLRGALNPLYRISKTSSFSTYAALLKQYPAHTIIDMPALSPTMEIGNVGAWRKDVGDKLSPGDVLVEIETDKATMDFEFQDEGYLAKILVPEGTSDVKIGTPIGVFVVDKDTVPEFADFTLSAAPAASEPAPVETATSKSEPAVEPSAPSSKSGRIFASPLAKKLAGERGIALEDVPGSGPNGRIIQRDIDSYKPNPAAKPAAKPAAAESKPAATPSSASAQPVASANYTDTPISNMRSVIGRRLKQSKQDAPDFIVSSNISVSKLLQLRASLNAASNGEYKISINDIIVKAVSLAAQQVPAVKTQWLEKENVLREFNHVDVCVAVSTPKGLFTPIVAHADEKGLAAISKQVRDLAKRARENKLLPEEFQGGTITVSNMGMNPAVSVFTSILNPPQSAIVAIGALQRVAVEDPVAESGISFDDVIAITGTFDHRVVDGAVAGEFMKSLKTILENPLRLLL